MKKQGNPLQGVSSNHHLEVLRETLIKVCSHPELALLISVHLRSLKFEV